MTPTRKGWDWWSEAKLQILSEYLRAFTTAVTGRSHEVTCLDLFAGSYNNERRWAPGTFPGSAQIALQTIPAFTRLAFFELADPATKLEAAIRIDRPTDNRWKIFPGDCNSTVAPALQWLDPVRWAPTFAFLDPRGLQVAWSTLETLAKWRADKKTKVEQWMLLPEPALARVLGLRGANGQRSADRLDRLYGTRDWVAIHQLRRRGDISPEEMRAEFVNLLRWRLEKDLGYKTTHALQLVNTSGQPVYTMVFATDSDAGNRIMSHVYDATTTRTIPTMQARAQAARQRRREDSRGLLRFPGLDDIESTEAPPRGRYEHVPPWQPQEMTDDTLELDGEEDIDPDDINADAWADELDGNDS
jgi:three-Cys-motif partner protein